MKKQTAIEKLFEADRFPLDAFYFDNAFKDRKVFIYGAGEGFHWIEEILMRFYGLRPAGVFDRKFTRDAVFKGLPAFSPDWYVPSDDERREAVVIISIGNPAYHGEVIQQLQKMGFQRIVLMMDIYEIHNPFNLPQQMVDDGFDYFKRRKKPILQAFKLFTDDVSRTLFFRCLQTHMQRKPVVLPAQPRNEQYFPKDVQLTKGYDRFINCGAYDGDTLRLLNSVKGRVDEIACFECVPELYAGLADYLGHHKQHLARNTVTAFPCAVYSHDGLANFISGGGLGSRISHAGDTVVQCVTLDHALAQFNPTFICMDVEGAEPEALKGARSIIQACRPDLGICVYHAPDHLWEIPLYLDNLGLGYRFFLRNYTTFTSETVLYATC